jgi:uncharacterized protein (TIGR02266 family)
MPDHFRTRARAEMRVIVKWRPASAAAGSEVDATTTNLGVGGAFLPSKVPLPVGTAVVVLLSSPTSWDPIEIPAVVRWVTEAGTEKEAGMGVQFLEMSDRDVVRLNDLLQLRWEEDE